jgi:FkbM family methyltransferase
MKNKIKRLLKPILSRIGFVEYQMVDYYKKDVFTDNLIYIIKSHNFNPKLIVDIGANHGFWTRIWKKNFGTAKFLLIEPQYWLKSSFEDLLDENTIFLPIGVGAKNEIKKFTINKNRDDSSTFMHTEDDAKLMGFNQIDVEIKSLDSLILENGGLIPEIIKIDAEGLDLEILKGSEYVLGKTEMFLIEAAINCDSMPNNLLDLVQFMSEKNYKIFDITDLNRPFKSQALWLIEVVFVKRNGFFDSIDWKQ